MANVKVGVIISDKLKQRLSELTTPETMLQINNNLAKRCNPYVPFLNGPLSETHEVSPEGVTYIQPYARYQYYGDEFNHTLDYHPLASSQWDKAMLRDHSEEFTQETVDILKRRLEQIDGR